MKWVKLGLLLVTVYVAALLVTLPANQAYGWIKPTLQQSPVRLYALSGTPWSGKAGVVKVANILLEDISWRVEFLPLLMGRAQLGLHMDFGKQYGDKNVQASVGKGLMGATVLSGLNGVIPVKKILEMGNIRFAEAEGDLILNDISLHVTKDSINVAEGELKWINAQATVLQTVDLDEISINLSEEKNMLKAVISSSAKSAVDVNGVLTLKPDGEYNFTGKVAERRNIGLSQILGGRYRKGRDGKYSINYKDKLPLSL